MTASVLAYCGRRILDAPLLPPDLSCNHAANEGDSDDSCLASEAHGWSGSSNPLQLKIGHAEPSGRPTSKRQHNRPTRITSCSLGSLTATC